MRSQEEVDEDKEMKMFARRFKRFMRSNKGREFQKKEGLKLESTKEKDLIICYECNDEDSFDDEVANLCLMAINDPKVTSNSSTLNDYSFDELQDAYDELGLKF
ncbi:hypothetical protein Goshw_014642 [Gossypium schwendimanii]|uniref:Uncharacterized protein n=1 Tax=Gossypium schwendimanii TaxID=34291 RepID=A0A7J9MCI1_GOSSC|nr:hypothetical protein [Gossypium schwendimanii]